MINLFGITIGRKYILFFFSVNINILSSIEKDDEYLMREYDELSI